MSVEVDIDGTRLPSPGYPDNSPESCTLSEPEQPELVSSADEVGVVRLLGTERVPAGYQMVRARVEGCLKGAMWMVPTD